MPSEGYRLPMLLSIALHLLLFGAGTSLVLEQVKYGSGPAPGPIGVELVERAPKSVEVLSAPHPHEVQPLPNPPAPKRDDVVIPRKKRREAPAAPPPPTERASPGEPQGSETAGRVGAKGAEPGTPGLESASPAYYRNPAPRYPRAAREERIEGVVRLSVRVSADGEPLQVNISRSSGSELLDRAALEAVERWRFRPAKLLGREVESTVEIPIRFKLE